MKKTLAKILLIDDHVDTLDLLTFLLSEQGYMTQSTVEPQNAVNLAEEINPDLILLDITMPKLNGYQVCSSLKSNNKTCDIPVIFLSALDTIREKIKGFDVGCVDYITKPFDLEEVTVRVKQQLEIRSLQKQLNQKNKLLKEELEKRIAVENKLRTTNQKLRNLATIDGLTKIANRRTFELQIKQEWLRLSREKLPLSLIIVDVDHFKLYNDSYGHQAGDNCLQQIAQAISKAVRRPADLVARYGGEEFAVILPHTDSKGAIYIANRIKKAIEYLKISHASSPIYDCVTVSQGIATTIPQADNLLESLVCKADVALYDAKERGRNSFVCYSL